MSETDPKNSEQTPKRKSLKGLRKVPEGPRVIMRIEITPTAQKLLDEVIEAQGMTKVATMSRLIEWFERQPPKVQAMIVGHVEIADEGEISREILKNIIMRIA